MYTRSMVRRILGGVRVRRARYAAAVAAGLLLGAGGAWANTIQLISTGVTGGPVDTTYQFEAELTPNNGLSSSAQWQSGLVLLDFPGLVSVSLAHNAAGEVTSAGDWTTSMTATGAGSLPNANYNPATGMTTLFGSVAGDQGQALDSSAVGNVVLAYTGSAGVNASHNSEFNLIGLNIVASSGLSSALVLESLSRDTTAAAIGQTESFPVPISPGAGAPPPPPAVALPSAAAMGFSALAAAGMLSMLRRRRSAAG